MTASAPDGRDGDRTAAFDDTEYPLPVGTVVDASAGTGKTYAVAAHVTLALARDRGLSIGQILITTFTRNAAAELRDRVRRRIVATAALLRGGPGEPADALDHALLAAPPDDRAAAAASLERAAAEFDTATIATIHAVCSKVLKASGYALEGDATGDDRPRIIAESVNDELVRDAVAGRRWSEGRMHELVDAATRDPLLVPWIDPAFDAEQAAGMRLAGAAVSRCVTRVHDAMQSRPGFDDLLRLAWNAVSGADGDAVVRQLRDRYRLAIVDEAQDTDPLQWKFFRRLFPGTDGRRLVTVGDPKQAIYGFRGADVEAYVAFTERAARRTLPINRRTDRPLLESLNQAMEGAVFLAERVVYNRVEADERNLESRIVGPSPLEFVLLGEANSQDALVEPAVRKIVELLDPARAALKVAVRAQAGTRPVRPGDICVIVRTRGVGNRIAKELARIRIRAVTAGTASVMKGRMADDVRSLLEAMERPSSPGRIKRVAVTRFFGGHSLRDAGTLADDAIRPIQAAVSRLAGTVQRRGIAACGAEIAAHEAMMADVTAGPEGQRHLADLAHILELLHEHGPRGGCRPDELLATFARLERLDDEQELVVRRVESDDDAVKIMTVHAAKGLEFPCVIVADLWKAERSRLQRGPGIFHDAGNRRLDLAHALELESPVAAREVARLHREEQKRLLYVAVTRAKHHLCVLAAETRDESVLPEVLRRREAGGLRPAASLAPLPDRWRPPAAPEEQGWDVAPLPPGGVRQSSYRTSFSGITARRHEQLADAFAAEGRGHDEQGDAAASGRDAADPALPEPSTTAAEAGRFEPPDLPAGTLFGSVVHEIYERIDMGRPLDEAVAAAVAATATSKLFDGCRETLSATILRSLRTPFGGPLGNLSFADVPPQDRLAEMDFEMALAGIDAGVKASDVGRVLAAVLPADDPLRNYAAELADPSFDIPLAGLVTGSVDLVLRTRDPASGRPRLVIADYKTNKLHATGARRASEAYAPERLVAAMSEHHYPLQAAIYGVAVYRLLRWRLREADPADCLAGVVYAFIRGTHGPDAPADAAGRRHGMFVWRPPSGLWPRLSRLFAGERP